MPAVGDLSSLRGSQTRSICKRASTIPADDLHARMGEQPLFEGLGFAVGKQVDGNPSFEIDKNRSIVPSTAEAKIVHAQHARRGHLGLSLFAHKPQEHVRTDL